jgi:hypothetical protein
MLHKVLGLKIRFSVRYENGNDKGKQQLKKNLGKIIVSNFGG